MPSKKDLILGYCGGYGYWQVRPYLKSLLATSFSGDIVWFCDSVSSLTLHKIAKHNVTIIHCSTSYPYLFDQRYVNHLPRTLRSDQGEIYPATLRYMLYYAYLKDHENLYKRVLHTDTRDVIFQEDLFGWDWGMSMHFTLEDRTHSIGTDAFNAAWVDRAFGNRVFSEISQCPISCSGVTFGGTRMFLLYLENMINFLLANLRFGGIDQGVHNFIVHSDLLPSSIIHEDDEHAISTISYFKPVASIRFNKAKGVLDKRGAAIPIVHQYDRSSRLLFHFNKLEYFRRIAIRMRAKFASILSSMHT